MEVAGYVDVKSRLPVKDRQLLDTTFKFQAQMRDAVRQQLRTQSSEHLSQVAGIGAGDISYKVDKPAEDSISEFGEALGRVRGTEVVSEGVGRRIFPKGTTRPEIKVLIDPVDGTRDIMYDMSSAWVITGIAKNRGESTDLSDITLSIMTEIPNTKQDKGSVVWAVKGVGAYEELWDLRENKLEWVRQLRSSSAQNLEHGFVVFGEPFVGHGTEIGDLRERVAGRILRPVEAGRALVFNNQILSTAEQVYRLATGKYRFYADLLPEVERSLNKKGKQLGMASRPYDLACLLIAEEAGVLITDSQGKPLSYPFDTHTNCGFIGYANAAIREQIEPVLLEELAKIN